MRVSLSWPWRLLVCLLVWTVPPLLHVVSIDRLASMVRSGRAARTHPPDTVLADAVDWWLNRLPWPWRTTCLKRAAIMYALLRRTGVDVELRVGVKRQPDRSFAAHAWLMRDGHAYLEHQASTYQSFQVIAAFPESVTTPS